MNSDGIDDFKWFYPSAYFELLMAADETRVKQSNLKTPAYSMGTLFANAGNNSKFEFKTATPVARIQIPLEIPKLLH